MFLPVFFAVFISAWKHIGGYYQQDESSLKQMWKLSAQNWSILDTWLFICCCKILKPDCRFLLRLSLWLFFDNFLVSGCWIINGRLNCRLLEITWCDQKCPNPRSNKLYDSNRKGSKVISCGQVKLQNSIITVANMYKLQEL